MKKRSICSGFALLYILAVCFLTGCGKDGNMESQKQEETEKQGETEKQVETEETLSDSKAEVTVENREAGEWSSPSSYREEINDMLCFDAKVVVSDSFQDGVFYKTKGYYQAYDADAFTELFFADKTIADKYRYELSDRNGEEKEGYAYMSDDGCTICCYPAEAIYSVDAEVDYYFYGFCDVIGNSTMYNADQYSLTEDLSFMTRKETEQKVQETLENMGFHTGDFIYQAYALDAPALCEESQRGYEWGFEEAGVDFRTDWEADQEAYAFEMWQMCQGLPVWTAQIGPLYIADESKAPVTGIYRKDGFVRFDVTDILNFETGNEYDVLLSFEEIVKKISEKYTEGMEEDKIVIKEMRLCALTIGDGNENEDKNGNKDENEIGEGNRNGSENRDGNGDGSENGNCTVRPVWICTGELEGDGNLMQMTFDAVTGNEIYEN